MNLWKDIKDEMPFESTVEWLPVNSKQDFARRYKKGEFGNASPTFDTPNEYLQSGYHGTSKIHIRNRVQGGPTYYDVEPCDFDTVWRMACQHQPPDTFYISLMAPTEKTVIQGELFQDPADGRLRFFYSTVKLPMRDALKQESNSVDWLTARGLLMTYMNQKSYDWLQELIDRYPGHVIEFSVYSVEWGTMPGYNTVFWEVRNY
jgi:hypothetical protein